MMSAKDVTLSNYGKRSQTVSIAYLLHLLVSRPSRLQPNSISNLKCLLVDEKIFCCHGGLSPDLSSMEQIRRIMRPTDVPDQGLLCDLLWSDPDKDTMGWGENDRGVSFTFGSEVSWFYFYSFRYFFTNKFSIRLLPNFWRSKNSIWFAELIKSLKMVMNSSPDGNWWHCFQHQITAVNSIMLVSFLFLFFACFVLCFYNFTLTTENIGLKKRLFCNFWQII